MSPGEKISRLRKNKGLSQELLAENSRTSLRTIQRIERGETTPRPFTLKAIADALDVQIDSITRTEVLESNTTAGSNEFATLKSINSSALLVLLFPLLNIILPFIIWRRNKNNPAANILARKIISFQILWTICTLLILVAFRLGQVSLTGSVAIGHFPILSILYLLLVAVNVFFILRTAVQLGTDPPRILSFVPVIL